ncbi:CaiB/BaiF CoA transferase family protein [Streptomyces nodosus]
MNDQTPHHDGPLSGHQVLDLSRALAGPHAGMMLGDLGARVIKIEAPRRGDDTRGWGPPFAGPEHARESTYFLSCNRNKESVTADLKSEEGRTLVARLVRRADVLIENFRPGVLERQGTGRGRVVRTSLLSSMVGIHSFPGTRWTVAGEMPRATGNQHPAIAPYGLFRRAGGELQLTAGSESLWRPVAEVTGLDPDDPRYAGNAELEAVFSRESAEQWIGRLDAAGVPAGRVRSIDEVYSWEQTRQQGLVLDVEHAALGAVSLPGMPRSFDGGGRTRHLPPPTLGRHDRSVRDWLDLEDAARDTGPAPAPTATAGAPR